MQTLDAALHLASLGFRVIPIRPGKKIPAIPKWPEAASNDPAVIRGWFGDSLGPINIGVALGEGTGLVVVDVDAHHGGAFTLELLEAEHGDLPPTPTVETPHGGRHLYFKYPYGITLKNNSSGLIGPGIDFRTDGGQCVLPPSSLDDVTQAYRWAVLPPVGEEGIPFAELPQWIIDRVRADSPRPTARKAAPAVSTTGGLIIKGNRNDGLFRALCALREHQGLGDSEIHSAADEINRTRCSPALPEAEVRTIASSVCRYPAGTPALDMVRSAPAEDAAPPEEKKIKWVKNRDGKLAAHVANVLTALRTMEGWEGCIRYDEFACSIVKVKPTPYGGAPGPWTDEDDTSASAWFAAHKLSVASKTVFEAINVIAHENPMNTVKEYLDGLRWDGKLRCDTWTERFMGAKSRTGDTRYVHAVSSKWLISAVARAYRPGCKVDHMLILEGEQGTGKSTAVLALCPVASWFTNDVSALGREAAMALRGKWLIEFSELQALAKHQVEEAKAFLSRDTDYFREPYARRAKDWPRRCVFMGTTNLDSYLSDETGNRRYWPLQCDTIRPDGIEAERDQLWAEAVVRFKQGEKWWLDFDQAEIARAEQSDRAIRDEWEPHIAEWVIGRENITVSEILERHLGIAKGDWKQADEKRVARCLYNLGWKKKPVRIDGKLRKAFLPPVTRVTRVTGFSEDFEPEMLPVDGLTGNTGNTCKSNEGCAFTHVTHVTPIYEINIKSTKAYIGENGYTRVTGNTGAELPSEVLQCADKIIDKAGGGNGTGH